MQGVTKKLESTKPPIPRLGASLVPRNMPLHHRLPCKIWSYWVKPCRCRYGVPKIWEHWGSTLLGWGWGTWLGHRHAPPTGVTGTVWSLVILHQTMRA